MGERVALHPLGGGVFVLALTWLEVARAHAVQLRELDACLAGAEAALVAEPAELVVQLIREPLTPRASPTHLGSPLSLPATWEHPRIEVSRSHVVVSVGEVTWLLGRSGGNLEVLSRFASDLMCGTRGLIGSTAVTWNKERIWAYDLLRQERTEDSVLPQTTEAVWVTSEDVRIASREQDRLRLFRLRVERPGWLEELGVVSGIIDVVRPFEQSSAQLFDSAGVVHVRRGPSRRLSNIVVSSLGGAPTGAHPTPFRDLEAPELTALVPNWDGLTVLLNDDGDSPRLIVFALSQVEAGVSDASRRYAELHIDSFPSAVDADLSRLRLVLHRPSGRSVLVLERPEHQFFGINVAEDEGGRSPLALWHDLNPDENEEEIQRFFPLPHFDAVDSTWTTEADLLMAPRLDSPRAWCLLGSRGLLAISEVGKLVFWRPGLLTWSESDADIGAANRLSASPNGCRFVAWSDESMRAFVVAAELTAGSFLHVTHECRRVLVSDDGVLFIEIFEWPTRNRRLVARDAGTGAVLGERNVAGPEEPPFEGHIWGTGPAGVGLASVGGRTAYARGLGPGYEPGVALVRGCVAWWHPVLGTHPVHVLLQDDDAAVEFNPGTGAGWLQIGGERWLASRGANPRHGVNSHASRPYNSLPEWVGASTHAYLATWRGELWTLCDHDEDWRLLLQGVREADASADGVVLGLRINDGRLAMLRLDEAEMEFKWPTTVIQPQGLHSYNGRDVGILTLGGYHVGEAASLSEASRRAALARLFVEPLPSHWVLLVGERQVQAWGAPSSPQRLEVLANRIATQTRLLRGQAARGYDRAIEEYEADLEHLHRTYYSTRHFTFNWPKG